MAGDVSEDFYIKFSSASSWEGRKHYLLAEPRERATALLPLLRRLIKSAADSSGIYPCPICNQDFEVSFNWFVGESDLGINTHCKTCNIIVLFKTNKIPLWAPKQMTLSEALEELGKRQPGEDV